MPGAGAMTWPERKRARLGEAQSGVARLVGLIGDLPEALSAYLSLVKESGESKVSRLAPDRGKAVAAAGPADRY